MDELKQILLELKKGQERIESKVSSLDLKVNSAISEVRSNFKYTNDKLEEHRL